MQAFLTDIITNVAEYNRTDATIQDKITFCFLRISYINLESTNNTPSEAIAIEATINHLLATVELLSDFAIKTGAIA